jgi:hypothetical protein
VVSYNERMLNNTKPVSLTGCSPSTSCLFLYFERLQDLFLVLRTVSDEQRLTGDLKSFRSPLDIYSQAINHSSEKDCLIPDIAVNGAGIAVTGKGKRSD